MSTDDLERKTAQTSGLRRLNKPSGTQAKPSTQKLVEHVPAWLKNLLTKYGEKEGRLIGLGEAGDEPEEIPVPVPAPAPGRSTTGALSNLLEQMAEEGVPEYPRDQLTTSVEWGSQAEPEAETLDDFLTQLGSEQNDYQDTYPAAEAPDWITGIQPSESQSDPTRYELPPQPSIEAEAPDWLTEMLGPSKSVSPPPPISPRLEDAPDWLTEALETPSSLTQMPPAASPSPPPASSTDMDVPDWLTAALEPPAAPPVSPAQAPPPAPPQAGFDIPDWLAETPTEPALPETFTSPTAVDSPSVADETPYTMDVPDWLGDIVSPPGLEEADPAASEAAVDVPDWLVDIAPPDADEVLPLPPAVSTPELPASDAPDRITPDVEGQAEESAKKPATPPQETSSWFAQAEGLPALDWLFEGEPAPPATAETEAPAQEHLDWLFDPSGTPPASPFETPAAPETVSAQTGEAIPAWWEDISVSPPVEEAETGAIPDWLGDTQEVTEAPEESSDPFPSWLGNLQTATSAPETDLTTSQAPVDWPDEAEETPSWWAEADATPPVAAAPEVPRTGEAAPQPVSSLKNLKSLKRVSPQPTSSAELETSPPLPDWAASLVPPRTEAGQVSPALPDWAAKLIPPAATTVGASLPALPDWAKVLLPPGVETKPTPSISEPREKPAPRLLQRLSSVSKSAPEPPAPLPTAKTPDWPSAPLAPMATDEQTAAESSDWLSDLSSAGVDESPDWMAETEPPTAEPSDWLSDLSSTGVDEPPVAESPDGLRDSPARVGEVPDWMAELTDSTQEMPEASTGMDDWLPQETSAEEENQLAERLDWFTQGRPEEEAAPAPTQAWTPPVEPEISDWLTDALDEASPSAPVLPTSPEAGEELESWDWLTDLPAPTAGEGSPASFDEAETPTGVEIPDWLADMSPSATPSAPVEPAAAEADVPSWLTEPPETPPVAWPSQTEPKAELETPSWFTELPEAPAAPTTSSVSLEQTEADLETPPWLTGLPDEALETPAWLTEWPETPATETTPPRPAFDIEAEIDEDLETPSWLTDLLEAHDPEAALSTKTVDRDAAEAGSETPPWLAQWPGVETMPAAPVEETDSDLEMPSWLADLGQASEVQTPFPTQAVETEEGTEIGAIPWLTLSPPPAGETETTVSVEESDIEWASPAWLTELPEASTTETAPTGLVEETEKETPAWFDELAEAPAAEAVVGASSPTWPSELAEAPETEATRAELIPAAEPETPSWLAGLREVTETAVVPESAVEEVEIQAEPEFPSWLSELPEVPGAEEVVKETEEDELEIPAWLSELPEAPEAERESAQFETIQTTEAELEPAPVESVEETETEAELEMPAWLSELPEAETESAQFETNETETRAEMPAWLRELPEAETESAQFETSETETRAEMPAWLADLPEAVEAGPVPLESVEETETEAELEMPAWLSELPEAVETEPAPVESVEETETEAELEMPAWLSELPEAETESAQFETNETETRAEMPAWLRELPEAETESAQFETSETETRAEMPAWLADLPEAVEAGPVPLESVEETETEAELEMPAWLSELPEAVELEPAPVESVEETEAEAELEMPAWLSELPEAVEAGPAPLESVEETEAEAKLEMPEAVEVGLAPVESVKQTEAEAELEMPAWLADLPEAVETGPAPLESVEETETEAELEIPAWLSELSAVETESAQLETSEPETRAEMPAWLADLPQAVEAGPAPVESVEETEAEAELEMPAWLSELSAVEAESAQLETSETETRAEMPAWLSELPEAVEAGPAPVEETEAEAELEMPAWPSELPAVEAESVQLETSEPETRAEMPAWLADLPQAVELEPVPVESVEETEAKAEPEMPAWLSELSAVEAESAQLEIAEIPVAEAEPVEVEEPPAAADLAQAIEDETTAEAELDEVPPWLADLSSEDLKLPSWLSDTPEFAVAPTVSTDIAEAEAELEAPPAQEVSPADSPVDESTAEAAVADKTDETELPPESDWLAGLGAAMAAVKAAMPVEEVDEAPLFTTEEAPKSPAWLTDTPKTVEAAEATALEAGPDSEPFVEPEAPDWLKDLSDPAAPLAGGATAETLRPLAEPKPSPAERMSDWLRTMKPSEETLTAEDDQVAESTGVLTGLAPLLPVEKIATPTPLLVPQATTSIAQADAMLEATRHFYAIATQRPQPIALPEPLTRRDQLAGNMIRGVLYLLFIILVALPLIPRLQKVVDPTTGQKAAWTEPAGLLSEVLDKQRRELVSAQLGVIDLQQPGAVALVSFDYSTATQGEMQPLAEDIIGRLRGQGVRLIFISLEPEGATLAQQTLDQMLAARNETYGAEMVNLGYVPGQIVGIRELVTGRKQLSTLADFKEGLTFAAPERSAWSGINNLAQVDVVITLSDNPATARWWIEQMATAIPPDDGERYLLAGSSATADPFLRPYLDSQQLDGLISGINGAAAIEAGRKSFGPARQMLDSQGIAHLLIVILIALGTMFGWMPPVETKAKAEAEAEVEVETEI